MSGLSESARWRALAERARASRPVPELFAEDPQRFERWSWELDGVLVDLSRHPLTDDVLHELLGLARECAVPEWIEALFRGERVNRSEGRPALHPALRGSVETDLEVDGEVVAQAVAAERARMDALARGVRDGDVAGWRGAAFRDVVHLGIGGSEAGPRLGVELLDGGDARAPRIHFASSGDGRDLVPLMERLDPDTTLFVVASKSFTTTETLTAARTARDWVAARAGDAWPRHFVGVSANDPAMAAFGLSESMRLGVREWVGGRYSLASAMGFPMALADPDGFRRLLEGMHAADRHYRQEPLAANVPVLLALAEVWQIGHFGATGHVVLPYHPALGRLPAYLQQLDMESLGKSVTQDGAPVTHATGGVFWGEIGSSAQHSFFQWLHQGTGRAVVEMWVPADDEKVPEGHRGLVPASAIGQAQALMLGRGGEEDAHVRQAGSRPVTMVLLERLCPYTLGQLIAVHEHRVFTQAVLWGINPFDQWGVELGKRLSNRLVPVLTGEAAPEASDDAATRGAAAWLRRRR